MKMTKELKLRPMRWWLDDPADGIFDGYASSDDELYLNESQARAFREHFNDAWGFDTLRYDGVADRFVTHWEDVADTANEFHPLVRAPGSGRVFGPFLRQLWREDEDSDFEDLPQVEQFDLDSINEHRRRLGMKPLDLSDGWSEEELAKMAKSIRVQGTMQNPRSAELKRRLKR